MELSQHRKALYQKYLDNDYSEQELDELLEYFYNSGEQHDLSMMIRAELAKEEDHVKSQGILKNLLAELDRELFAEIKKRSKPVKRIKLWPRIRVAASIAFAIGMGIWFYTARPRMVKVEPKVVSQEDIAPGKNIATLTFKNGNTIKLSDAKTGLVIGNDKLIYNDGSGLGSPLGGESGHGIEMITMATPRGGTYQVTLPDGSKVWLNAASSIVFPSTFIGLKTREVELSGEAYFEVAQDPFRPFIVITDKQEVEVLGTHFNISSYADERAVKTTLLEGSVRVSVITGQHTRAPGEGTTERLSGGQQVILKPDEQAVLSASSLKKEMVDDAEAAILWKNGKFGFDSEEIGSIMRQIARWYNVEIVYADDVQNVKVSGSVSRFASISTLLEKLQQTGLVKFKVEARKVVVSK